MTTDETRIVARIAFVAHNANTTDAKKLRLIRELLTELEN